MSDNHGTQALWPQMIAALAAIDEALGLPQDGCNSTAQTLHAIRQLRTDLTAAQAREQRLRTALAAAIKEADGWHDECRGEPCEGVDWCRDALAIPQDDSALREMIAAEREACAKVCDNRYMFMGDDADRAVEGCAAAIRYRNVESC